MENPAQSVPALLAHTEDLPQRDMRKRHMLRREGPALFYQPLFPPRDVL